MTKKEIIEKLQKILEEADLKFEEKNSASYALGWTEGGIKNLIAKLEKESNHER